jgi:hypothetical protein
MSCFGDCATSYPNGSTDFKPLRCCIYASCTSQCANAGVGC